MPSLFDLNDISDMNIVKNAYDKIYGRDAFYHDYKNDSFTSLQKKMQSLTDSYNELADFRFRAMNKELHDFEKEYIKKQCNKKQLAYINEKVGVISERERKQIANEFKDQFEQNASFWEKIQGGE